MSGNPRLAREFAKQLLELAAAEAMTLELARLSGDHILIDALR